MSEPKLVVQVSLRVLSVYSVVEFPKKKIFVLQEQRRYTKKNNKVQTINLHYAVYNTLFVLKIRNIPKTACNAIYAKVVVKPQSQDLRLLFIFVIVKDASTKWSAQHSLDGQKKKTKSISVHAKIKCSTTLACLIRLYKLIFLVETCSKLVEIIIMQEGRSFCYAISFQLSYD